MPKDISLRQAFGNALVQVGKERKDFVVLDADVAGGTCTNIFRDRYPGRFIQCGIAEQNMMGVAAGLSTMGIIPIVTAYSVFTSMRAIEQARNSIAYPNLNVKIVASHLGLDVGPDGPTHQSIEDISIYRAIPNFIILAPADPNEMEDAFRKLLSHKGPAYMRTGRSPVEHIFKMKKRFVIGKWDVLQDGSDVTIFALQKMLSPALKAAALLKKKNISAAVINVSTLKPADKDLILKMAKKTGAFVTAEDHNIRGGIGSIIAEISAENCPVPIEYVGINDVFGESGNPDDLMKKYGLTAENIIKKAERAIKRKR